MQVEGDSKKGDFSVFSYKAYNLALAAFRDPKV
jgi:hypothetical protein